MLSLCFPTGDLAAILTVAPDNSASLLNIFFMEFFQTFILVYVIFAVAFDTVDTKPVHLDLENVAEDNAGKDGASSNVANVAGGQKQKSIGKNLTIYTTTGNTKAGFAPISIGFTLGFLCFIGGSVSGGAFNPIRVLAPGKLIIQSNFCTFILIYKSSTDWRQFSICMALLVGRLLGCSCSRMRSAVHLCSATTRDYKLKTTNLLHICLYICSRFYYIC